jgi:hypothetical protein
LTYKPKWYIIEVKGGDDMQKYKEAYYKLFASVSETIDLIEDILPQITDKETKKLLEIQAKNLKTVQQFSEEIIISD